VGAPLGLLSVDQAGAGLRGYALPADNAEVTDRAALSIHTLASNNFYREQTDSLVITQRYDTCQRARLPARVRVPEVPALRARRAGSADRE
jgi:hypothetical protein